MRPHRLLMGFVLSFIVLCGWSFASAQTSCSCSAGNGGCSVSQTCEAGYLAICTCSATGCTSSCQSRDGQQPELLGPPLLSLALTGKDADEISSYLTDVFGKMVKFSPKTKNAFIYGFPGRAASYWDVFDYLERNGTVTVNGSAISFWRDQHRQLKKGGELVLCVGGATPDAIARHLSFISGSKIDTNGGVSQMPITSTVRGKGLLQILNNLTGISGGVMFAEKAL